MVSAWVLGVLLRQTPTEDVSDRIVPFIEFKQTDVRVALSWLMQSVGARYRFAPEVKGYATVSLRKVTLEVAVMHIVRQAEATYLIDSGEYLFVSRSDGLAMPFKPLRDQRWIRVAYQRLVAGPGAAGMIDDNFFWEQGGGVLAGHNATEGFLRFCRENPVAHFGPTEELSSTGKSAEVARVFMIVKTPGGERRFFDDWSKRPGKPWRLLSRSNIYLSE